MSQNRVAGFEPCLNRRMPISCPEWRMPRHTLPQLVALALKRAQHMSLSSQIELNALIADVAAIAAERLPAADHARLAPYFTAYFEEAEGGRPQRAALLDLYGAAMAPWTLPANACPASTRCAPTTRILSATVGKSTHTAIEIVNDDMPFLIDSVAMLLATTTLTLHCWCIRCWKSNATPTAACWTPVAPAAPAAGIADSSADRPHQRSAQLATVVAELERVLTDIRLAVEDETGHAPRAARHSS